MVTADATAARTANPPRYGLFRAGSMAAAGAAALNAGVYFVGRALGAVPRDVLIPNAGEPLTVVPVVVASAAGAIGGTIVYALMRRFLGQPVVGFRVVAAVVLLLSFFTPFTIPGAPAAMRVTLELMHVVVASVTVWALTARRAPAA